MGKRRASGGMVGPRAIRVATMDHPMEIQNRVEYKSEWRFYIGVFFCIFLGLVLSTEFIVVSSQPVMPTEPLCLAGAVTSDKTAQRMRAVIGAPNGFASCAVVGSAGFLRLERLGTEIEQHEFVIRANLAPVGGFEEIVGTKTSIRVLNSEALATILYEKQCGNQSRIRQSICSAYPLYLNTGDRTLVNRYRKLCPDTIVFDNTDLDAWDSALHAQWQGIGVNLMSGAYAIAIALKLCPNGTDVYGVSHNGTFELNRNESSTYHYHDDRIQSAYDSLPKSASMLSRLAGTQGTCLKLHTPKAFYSQYKLPGSKNLIDLLVDDVKHDQKRNAYMKNNQLQDGCRVQ